MGAGRRGTVVMDDTLKAEIAFQVPGLRGVGCMAVTDDITVTGLSNRSGTTQPAPTRNQPEQYCLAVGGKSESVEVFHIAATRMKDEADASANVEKKPSGTTPRAGRRRGSIFTWFGRTGRTSSASSIRRITGGMPLVRASLMKSGGYRPPAWHQAHREGARGATRRMRIGDQHSRGGRSLGRSHGVG